MYRFTALLWIAFLFSPIMAAAQSAPPNLVGGLTALATTPEATWPNFTTNAGFEQLAGGRPVDWLLLAGSEAAWSADTVAHSGTYSMRMTGVAGAEAYEVMYLEPGQYKMSGWIKTGPRGSGTARLMLDLRRSRYETVPSGCQQDCGIDLWHTSYEVPAGRDWTKIEMAFTVTDADVAASKGVNGRIKAWAVLDGYWASAQLTAWYDEVQVRQQTKFPLDVFMRYPNYRGMLFGDQAQGLRFHVVPRLTGSRYRLVATLRQESSGTVIERQEITLTPPAAGGAPDRDVELNAADASGVRPLAAAADHVAHLAEFLLCDDGTAAASAGPCGSGTEVGPRHPTYRVYKMPAGSRDSMRVSFDEKNRVLFGGIPRFVLGVYDAGLGSVGTSTDWEQLLWSPTGTRRMQDLPIDLYLNYHLGDTGADVINSLMDNLANHGAGYLQTGNCVLSSPASDHNPPAGFKIDQPGTNGSYPYITANPPAGIGAKVAGYYTADECSPELIPGVFAQYQRLIALDGDSMTFGALFGTPDLPLWRDSLDVMSTDPYPLYGAEPSGGYDHNKVAQWTRMTREAVQDSRPFFTVLQFFKFDASRSSPGRWPTKTEMRNHAYMAIVEGARGLFWWSLGENGLTSACRTPSTWCAERTVHMQELRDVMAEISQLEQPLLSDDVTGWGSPGDARIATKFKRVRNVDGNVVADYIFAYNTTKDTVTATFTFTGITPASITVYGENRTLPTSSDTFGPEQAHVYVIRY